MRNRSRPSLTLTTIPRRKFCSSPVVPTPSETYAGDELLSPASRPLIERNVYELGFLSPAGNRFIAAISSDGRELERREVRTVYEQDEAIAELRELLDLMDPPQGARSFGLVDA